MSDNNPLDKLPTPGGDNRGPQNQRSFLVTLLIIVAIVAYLAFSTGQSPLSSSDTVDTLATNEFVTAVKDDRVSSVTFKTSDGSISGDYWTSEDDLGDKSKLQKFKSYYVGADSLEELMAKHSETSFTIDTSDGSAWETILLSVVPTLLLVGVFVYYMRRMSEQNGRTMDFAKTKAQTTEEERPKVKFSDVAGIDEAVEELKEVRDFLREPERYQKMGAKIPHGVLLVGPPGTGKTLLAKAVAGEAGVPFFSISGSDFVEMFVGVGASRVRDLFKQAKAAAPCIIFIDEIDAVGRQRGTGLGGGHDEREQTLNQLLAELDGFDPTKGVIVLGATNRPEVLDKALLRPGRFDRRITVDRPNLAGRLATLQVHTRNIRLSEDVNLEKIAAATAGCVGADLANLVNEAALRAVRMGRQAVNQNDLLASFEMVIAGAEKKGTVLTEKEKKLIAYHEVGHALVAARQKNTQPVSKITIVPHTQGALGYTMQTPEEEKFLEDREELLADLRTLLGGRAAEWAVFHTMTTGASNDIERATDLARKMVTMYGMSDRFGVMGLATIQNQYLDGSAGMNCAEATAAQVDEEVRKLIDDAYHDAVKMLEDDREMLDKIAAYLLEKETITGQEMMAILEGRDPALVDNYGATPEEPRKRRLDGDVEPPARSVHMISEPPVNPFVQPSEDAQDENQAPDAEEDAPASGNVDPDAAPQDDTTPDSEQ